MNVEILRRKVILLFIIIINALLPESCRGEHRGLGWLLIEALLGSLSSCNNYYLHFGVLLGYIRCYCDVAWCICICNIIAGDRRSPQS